MNIVITRSFSRTKQIAQFEPINASCSAQLELDLNDVDAQITIEKMERNSTILAEFCRAEVEKTIEAEIAKRKPLDKAKIADGTKVESELDAGKSSLDAIVDKQAGGYREA